MIFEIDGYKIPIFLGFLIPTTSFIETLSPGGDEANSYAVKLAFLQGLQAAGAMFMSTGIKDSKSDSFDLSSLGANIFNLVKAFTIDFTIFSILISSSILMLNDITEKYDDIYTGVQTDSYKADFFQSMAISWGWGIFGNLMGLGYIKLNPEPTEFLLNIFKKDSIAITAEAFTLVSGVKLLSSGDADAASANFYQMMIGVFVLFLELVLFANGASKSIFNGAVMNVFFLLFNTISLLISLNYYNLVT